MDDKEKNIDQKDLDKEAIDKLIDLATNQKDIPEDIMEIIDKHFWDMI